MKQFHYIDGLLGVASVYGVTAESKRCVLRCVLKVATKMAEWRDSGRSFQTGRAQEWKALAPVLVLTLGTDRLIPLFDLNVRDGSDAASMEWR